MTPPSHGCKRGNAEPCRANAAPGCRWFVLQALDPVTDCPVLEARFGVFDSEALRAVLGSMAEDDPGLIRRYHLDSQEVRAVAEAFGVAFDPGGREVMLEPWHPIRGVPYLVHTGFELALMLEGRKPLAVFSDTGPSDWLDEHMRRFDPFVAGGRLVRRKLRTPMPKPCRGPDGTVVDHLQRIYYALPGEEWRMDAHALLWEVMEKSGWNEALERFEGSLLGYEDWQNDWWARFRRRDRQEAEAALAASEVRTPAADAAPIGEAPLTGPG